MKLLFPLASVCLLSAGLAAAQESSAPLARAQAAAASALASSPAQAARALRGAPDADEPSAPDSPLGNFRTVEPGLYRSAQPNAEGYSFLHDLGVRTILTLKGDAAEERKYAAPLGMTVMSVPMSGFGTPSFEEMDRALEIVKTAPRPLLVHCERGKDRTGFVVAAYRVAVEGMSIPDAVAEAKGAGCCFILFEDLTTFLQDYQLHRRAPL